MTVKEKLHFTYNNIYSKDMGVVNASVDGGLFEESFISGRNIIEEKTPYRDIPYYYGIEREPKQFELTLFFKDVWDDDLYRKVKKWLSPTSFKPLQFDDDEYIYFCTPIDEPIISHNGNRQGYITLTMRCDSPYAYSSFYSSDIYDLSKNKNGHELTAPNFGDLICRPQIDIEKISDGDVSIINKSNGGQEFKFTGLKDKEKLFVDCKYEDIESSLSKPRYDNFNNQYLELVEGNNYLMVHGKCKIQFKYRYIFE